MRGEIQGEADGAPGPPTVPVVVAGAVASKAHNGGEAWVRMSWLQAVRSLGRDVWLFEQIDDPTDDQRLWFGDVARWFGVEHRAVLADGSGRGVVAPAGVDPIEVASEAEVLLNISGHLHGPSLFERFRNRVLVDIDPGYTQMWHAQGLTGAMVDGHDSFATIGENIGDPECTIPTNGLPWIPTRQPTSTDAWVAPEPPGERRFTTVASWRGSYGPVEFDGRRYGIKAHEFRRIRDLPDRCPGATLEIALDIHPGDDADRKALVAAGWSISDPAAASSTPERFRSFVHGSSAELSVAQGMYVDTRSGWFSDRTARYLAAGRPAVVQDTGLGRNLPTGTGLLAFDDAAGAAAAIESVMDDYPRHSAAARAIAEKHLSPSRIIADLFRQVL